MTVILSDILSVLDQSEAFGDLSVRLSGVSHDSRKILPGYLFVAIRGEKSDGHEFVRAALDAGAAAVMAEIRPKEEFCEIPWVTVPDTRKHLRANFVDNLRPAHRKISVGWSNGHQWKNNANVSS